MRTLECIFRAKGNATLRMIGEESIHILSSYFLTV